MLLIPEGPNMIKVTLCSINNIVGVFVWFNIPEFFIYRAIYKKQMR